MLSLLSWTQATKSQLTSNNFNANRNIHRDQQSVSARQWFPVENTVNLQHEFCITPNFSIIIFMYKCHLMLITLKVFHCICPAGEGERRGGQANVHSDIWWCSIWFPPISRDFFVEMFYLRIKVFQASNHRRALGTTKTMYAHTSTTPQTTI